MRVIRYLLNNIARTAQAAFVDDDVERVTMVKIEPMRSKPGGSEVQIKLGNSGDGVPIVFFGIESG